jgi:hypothetical protein
MRPAPATVAPATIAPAAAKTTALKASTAAEASPVSAAGGGPDGLSRSNQCDANQVK